MGSKDPLKKERATRSSILAWKIPWTGNLARYSSWGHKESDTTKRLSTHTNTHESKEVGNWLIPGIF